MLNTTDPANTANLVTAINLPSEVSSVALAGGIALVATDAGLLIANYRAFDNLGIAPTVTISSSTLRLIGPGGQEIAPTGFQFRRGDRTVQATYASLPQGNYQIRANTSAIRDLAGNAASGPEFTSSFFGGGSTGVSIINQGTINANVSGRTLTVRTLGNGTFTNSGTATASASAGTLTLNTP